MKTTNSSNYTVTSSNFDWHEPIACDTFDAALAVARRRGFEARIQVGATLVAVWSPLYGTRVYSRTHAA